MKVLKSLVMGAMFMLIGSMSAFAVAPTFLGNVHKYPESFVGGIYVDTITVSGTFAAQSFTQIITTHTVVNGNVTAVNGTFSGNVSAANIAATNAVIGTDGITTANITNGNITTATIGTDNITLGIATTMRAITYQWGTAAFTIGVTTPAASDVTNRSTFMDGSFVVWCATGSANCHDYLRLSK